MKLSGVVAVLMGLASPAIAGECVWVSHDEHAVAEETDIGYVITYPGSKVPSDFCTDESAGPGTLARIAKCTGGWEGVIFFAPAELDKPGPDERMVLMNALWYKVCNKPLDIGYGE